MTVALVAGLVPSTSRAQVPDTDIWVADIIGRGGALRLGLPVNATHRDGYDNQPAFLYRMDAYRDADGDPVSIRRLANPQVGVLYTSADSLGATDIFRWDPYTKTSVRVTRTPESEYSPTPFGVGSSGGPSGFYAVRVEADSAQRLWQFDIDGSNPRVVMADVDSIGYFAWIDDNHLAAFVLGNEEKKEPHTLRLIDVKAQTETVVARDIGRSIQRAALSDGDISFTMHEDDDTWRFFVLKRGRTVGDPLIDAVGNGQDAAWLGDGTMLMSADAAIYASSPATRSGPRGAWRKAADFSNFGITTITRIAVDWRQDKIAFVAVTRTP